VQFLKLWYISRFFRPETIFIYCIIFFETVNGLRHKKVCEIVAFNYNLGLCEGLPYFNFLKSSLESFTILKKESVTGTTVFKIVSLDLTALKLASHLFSLKGQCHKILTLGFFHQTIPPGPLIHGLKPF
jgi:hypothetical protein